MREPQPPDERQIAEKQREMVRRFGAALGLDPEFVAAVAADGQRAIIERAELVDRTGAMAVLLSMSQRLGMFMQAQAEQRGDMRPGVLLDVAERVSDFYGIDEDLGVMLLGSNLEVFQQTLRRLKRMGEHGTAGGRMGPDVQREAQ